MSLIFTPLGQDTFNRPNESPLNPSTWTVVSNLGGPSQLVNHFAEITQESIDSLEYGWEAFTGTAVPNDQYGSATIQNLADENSEFDILLRADTVLGTNYDVGVDGPMGAATIFMNTFVDNEAVGELLTFSCTINPGDILTGGVIGNIVFAALNGNIVLQMVDNNIPTQLSTAVQLAITAANTSDTQVSKWVVGSLSGTFPSGNASAWMLDQGAQPEVIKKHRGF